MQNFGNRHSTPPSTGFDYLWNSTLSPPYLYVAWTGTTLTLFWGINSNFIFCILLQDKVRVSLLYVPWHRLLSRTLDIKSCVWTVSFMYSVLRTVIIFSVSWVLPSGLQALYWDVIQSDLSINNIGNYLTASRNTLPALNIKPTYVGRSRQHKNWTT